ncbi:hypothetical protein P308_28565 [Pseudomonas piscis]|nr:hypothetical protein P308_28565 [Pseudomonas piscis]
MVLSTPAQAEDAEALLQTLNGQGVGVFSNATMHTPVGVTDDAMKVFEELGADSVIAIGGGSTIGLGKAIAYRNDAPQIVVPTTYAGSEVTPILGQTENGVKTTVSSPSILPEVVVYDPALTVGLPVGMSVTSALNAMAHAIEGLYAQNRNPITSLMANEGVKALKLALPRVVQDPNNLKARSQALYGAWLCGTVLGAVGMALHHKLCHTLGGSFDLPHAETHAIMLPHTAAFNQSAAVSELSVVTELFGGDLAAGLYSFAAELGAPLALQDIGLAHSDLDRAAQLAVKNPYWNPRPIEQEAIRTLLQNAWAGTQPT